MNFTNTKLFDSNDTYKGPSELHMMCDLETLDNSPTSTILSVALVPFDMNGNIYDEYFNKHISLNSCIKAGLTINESTFMWWMQQSQEARSAIVNSQKHQLKDVLNDMSEYIKAFRSAAKTIYLWGNGAAFDIAILRNAFAAKSIKFPFKPSEEQDVRTIVRLNPDIKHSLKFEGIQHDAKDDCVHQIKYLLNTMESRNILQVI
jgi:DNA polymerase III epsilon subunit-like protein